MECGIELIRKCSKLRVWRLFKKYKYVYKLIEWDKTLQGQLVILNVQTSRDVKETARDVKETSRDVKETARDVKETSRDVKEIAATVRNVKDSVVTLVNQVTANAVIQSQLAKPRALMSTGLVVPELPRFTVGLDTHLNELKMKLLKDGVSMLVLTAPGGCGKTTLANMLYHDQDVKGKFDKNIFFVNVSTKKSNYIVLQELCQLMGSKEADFPNEDIAFNCLQELMEEKRPDPLLLILDDVWPKSESLLEKFNDVTIQKNCNILVTSRSSFPGFDSSYPLVALNEKDAMTLFRHSAFRGDESYDVPEDLQDKIVRRCKGCPLAIKVVGKSLRGQRTESWLKRERELSKGGSIFDIETEVQVLLCLKSSLDALDEKDQTIKECFLDLGAFPEDQRIPATALIDMWAELYGLDADFLSIEYLQQLSTRSLANLVITRKEAMEADGYYSEHFVSQHDVLRDLAVFQAKLDPNKTRLIIDKCEGNVCKSLTEQKHQSTRILSISYDGVLTTNLHNIQLAEVEVLVLNFQTKKYALPEFVAEMAKLKVLIVTNHGFLPAELSNFQLLGSLPNLKRIRLERISIPSIIENRVQLKSLKKISLFMCSIGQAFSNPSFQNFICISESCGIEH